MENSLVALGLLVAFALSGAWYYATRPSPQVPVSPLTNESAQATPTMDMTLESSAFAQNGSIPSKYTCDGQRDLNPPLSISGVPEGTATLVLIVDDPDVPRQLKPDGVFDHWVLFNIPPGTAVIPEGESAGTAGQNGAGNAAYTGPCPPTQYEPSTHRYVFTLYALDTSLALQVGASKAQVLAAMKGHIIAQARLIGVYHKVQ